MFLGAVTSIPLEEHRHSRLVNRIVDRSDWRRKGGGKHSRSVLFFGPVCHPDGTRAPVADIFASEIVMGGIHNWLEVMANNHRAVCNINPNTAMQTYNPIEEQFRDVYVVEKIGTKQGWAPTAPDEDFAALSVPIEHRGFSARLRALRDADPVLNQKLSSNHTPQMIIRWGAPRVLSVCAARYSVPPAPSASAWASHLCCGTTCPRFKSSRSASSCQRHSCSVKADKAKAIASFLAGTDGFKDRDLYPFCFNISDGVTQAAPPSVRGKDVRTLKDASGKAYGEDIYKAAARRQGQRSELHVPEAGGDRAQLKGELRHKSGRSRLRRRLL